MSFLTKFGSHVYKSGLGLLNAAFSGKAPATIANDRSYHIMANCRTLGADRLAATSNAIVPTNVAAVSAEVGQQRLLTPFTSLLTQVAGFKVKGRLRRRCKDCYFVVRQQRAYVICPTHPRHKQMAMKKREKNTWILTHATQSKVRPY
ncbi:PREDICTED: 39S ribosomal protein L36, mitochondrial [Rhagoletis zephyria]|uniref:39S ribosomal protein L36, mitochondrial n=1 Tax=Rhagoletis zephyria TaxID=28612 RepID=UPI0008116FD8|nr:PREDICTED: 39S ribosomal protein L36, mitochondrial [Rhagoletis zephyria]XP_017462542.1 PREDICTED: 39S ribosomal protein L36, mitochondrial [Rhagoletis zephyria]